jgi:hypothetical protein
MSAYVYRNKKGRMLAEGIRPEIRERDSVSLPETLSRCQALTIGPLVEPAGPASTVPRAR